MILIFGGAYQGKLGYAKDNFKVQSVYDCRSETTGRSISCEPDLSADAICGLDAFVSECEKAGIEAADWFAERLDQWQDKVLIMEDCSQGVVPVDAHQRAAREMNGRLMIYLAGEANEVHRVFCSIGKRIK